MALPAPSTPGQIYPASVSGGDPQYIVNTVGRWDRYTAGGGGSSAPLTMTLLQGPFVELNLYPMPLKFPPTMTQLVYI